MARILAVDDDVDILSVIKRTLERDGHEIICARCSDEINYDALRRYDLIMLDIMMPGIDGIQLCRGIREMVDCPIVFLTAKVMDEDLYEGFSVGADDYIKKPFSIVELRARVNAHIRRETREYRNRIVSGDIILDLSSKELYCGNAKVELTKSEYNICEFLIQNKGQVFSLEKIIELALGFDTMSDIAAIREHIKNIRKKMSGFGQSPIETVWGMGYKWI